MMHFFAHQRLACFHPGSGRPANNNTREVAAQERHLTAIILRATEHNGARCMLKMSMLFYTPQSDHKVLDRALRTYLNFPTIELLCLLKKKLAAWLTAARCVALFPCERGEHVQVQEVGALVSSWILQLFF